MSRTLLALIAVAGLTGCQSAEQRADAKAASTEPEMKAYFWCGLTKADAMALSNQDPYYIAIAAQGECGSERLALGSKIDKTYNIEIRQRIRNSYDRAFIDGAITRVIKRRQTG